MKLPSHGARCAEHSKLATFDERDREKKKSTVLFEFYDGTYLLKSKLNRSKWAIPGKKSTSYGHFSHTSQSTREVEKSLSLRNELITFFFFRFWCEENWLTSRHQDILSLNHLFFSSASQHELWRVKWTYWQNLKSRKSNGEWNYNDVRFKRYSYLILLFASHRLLIVFGYKQIGQFSKTLFHLTIYEIREWPKTQQ